jgi:hypothetical protein
VESPFDFDLDRQDPKNPPPAPWTIQPSHPELLDSLAMDFRGHGYDLRRLIKMIVGSGTYAASARAPRDWNSSHESYFTRRNVRRLSAEQLWDAVSQLTSVQPELKITYSDKKVQYVVQTFSPMDVEKTNKKVHAFLQQFGQCDRYAADADRRPSMIQAALLLNDGLIRDRVKVQKISRLHALLNSGRGNEEIVDELYLAALARLPREKERHESLALLQENREAGLEDLLWVLVNRLEFLFY